MKRPLKIKRPRYWGTSPFIQRLFNGDGLGQVAGLVDGAAELVGRVIGDQLAGHRRQDAELAVIVGPDGDRVRPLPQGRIVA